jgi:DNA modification methylase
MEERCERRAPEIRLENQSCFEFWPTIADKSVDLVLIDPPYDISRKTGFSSVKAGVERFAVSMEFGAWDQGFEGLDRVVAEAYRALRNGGTAIIFYDLWKLTILAKMLEAAGFVQLRFVEWIKSNPVPLNSGTNYLTNAREIALVACKRGKPTFHSKYDNGIYSFPICHEPGRFHPTQKPLGLIEALLLKHSDAGDLVVDCFSGSGTTAAACARNDRRFAGCELDAGYWKKSLERLEILKQQRSPS